MVNAILKHLKSDIKESKSGIAKDRKLVASLKKKHKKHEEKESKEKKRGKVKKGK